MMFARVVATVMCGLWLNTVGIIKTARFAMRAFLSHARSGTRARRAGAQTRSEQDTVEGRRQTRATHKLRYSTVLNKSPGLALGSAYKSYNPRKTGLCENEAGYTV